MNTPRQKICKALGEAGCYLLCIVHLAEKILRERIDAEELYEAAEVTEVIEADCFVNDPAKLMKMMVPGNWKMEKYGMAYQLKEGEAEITRYERTTTAGTLTHFVVTDGKGGVTYDPLGDSQCVKLGKPVSKRVFRKVG
ncbi:MAG TPA: DUF261 family protein [Candidatus Paceibacterota bacterium]|nr:DUF261 family protein [Candidatus Paceibacterota bacterium]